MASAFQNCLNSIGRLAANQTLNLPDNLAFSGFRAKNETGDGNHNEQQRSQRKQGIKSQGCPETCPFMPTPFTEALAQKRFDIAPSKRKERLSITPGTTGGGGYLCAAGLKYVWCSLK